MYRQGDVLIVPTSAKIEGSEVPRDNGRVVLAYGEVTGHAHALRAERVKLFRDATGGFMLDVQEPAVVEHEEHAKIDLPKGRYRVIRQREFDAGEVRRVAD